MVEKEEDVIFVPEPDARKDAIASVAEEMGQLQEDIKNDLEDIKSIAGNNRTWFWRGIMQGAGAVIGSIIMVIFLGWFLSIIGVIPGFGEISDYMGGYLDKVSRY